MKKLNLNIDREYDAAIRLLKRWNVIGETDGYRVNPIKKTLLEYYKDKTYLFGPTLLDHLINSTKQKNIWIPEYLKDHDAALKRFLSETTQSYLGNGNDALKYKFNALSRGFERKYNIKVEYDESISPISNINKMIDIGTKKLMRRD